MKIDKIEVGYLQTNCYFITKNNDLIVVDPGDDYEKIKDKIGNFNLKAVFLTHNHFDHNGALEQLLNDYEAPVNPTKIESFNYEIISTPGHKEDSSTFYFPNEKTMFTGDFLFYQTIGRTDLPGGNNKDMQESLEKIKKYDDDITLYPGHGPETILGNEKLRFGKYLSSLS
ncbi:MAG: MBL fold metallo-hydrolase [Firmicutes bacterium]|nr:MBL fold metallo-hydrolase [Bacillota bacterium]